MTEGDAVIAVIARHRCDQKGKPLPLMNTDDTDRLKARANGQELKAKG